MINKFDISKYRTEVIENFIELESLINTIISFKYFRKDNIDFKFYILLDQNISFTAKVSIIENSFKNEFVKNDKKDKYCNFIGKLKDVNRIRNIFAHCGVKFEGQDGEIFTPNTISNDKSNPKSIYNPLDFEGNYKRFNELLIEVKSFIKENQNIFKVECEQTVTKVPKVDSATHDEEEIRKADSSDIGRKAHTRMHFFVFSKNLIDISIFRAGIEEYFVNELKKTIMDYVIFCESILLNDENFGFRTTVFIVISEFIDFTKREVYCEEAISRMGLQDIKVLGFGTNLLIDK